MLKCGKIKEVGSKERRRKKFLFIFIWFGKTKSFAYIPEWDQNHVVWSRKSSDWFWLILKFEKKKSLGKIRGRKGIEEIKEVSSIDFKLKKKLDWLKVD